MSEPTSLVALAPPQAETSPVGPIDKKLLDACIQCGLCLPACPTYLATGREMESPRGRIHLLSQWNQGEQELSPRLQQHIESCLGCLGCQTACPSGVEYENILNQARPHLAEKRDPEERFIMRFFFKSVLTNFALLRFLGALLRLWQLSGLSVVLAWLANPTGEAKASTEFINPIRKLLHKLSTWEELTPDVPPFKAMARKLTPKDNDKEHQAVQLFTGCVMDIFYNHVNHACARLLSAEGKEVQVPRQTCCGALAMHAGEIDIARKQAKRNIVLLERTQGSIAVTAAGCGAMLKEYGELLRDDPEWHSRAESLSLRVLDITECLSADSFPHPPKPPSAVHYPLKVAYHAACHLAHAQKVRSQPEKLLQDAALDSRDKNGVASIHLLPLRESEHCCGSAGIYNLLHAQMSDKVLERKIDCIAETGAHLVVTTNPGCMLQIEAGARKRGLPLRVAHLCEFLEEMYCPK